MPRSLLPVMLAAVLPAGMAAPLQAEGTAVHLPNRDTVRRPVPAFSAAQRVETQPHVGAPAAPGRLDRPGIAVLGCRIHGCTAAWVLALETPRHGLAGADGRLALAGAAP